MMCQAMNSTQTQLTLYSNCDFIYICKYLYFCFTQTYFEEIMSICLAELIAVFQSLNNPDK